MGVGAGVPPPRMLVGVGTSVGRKSASAGRRSAVIRSIKVIALAQPGLEEEIGAIDELHQLDLAEPIRQVAIVALPIKLICREDCPGLPEQADLADGQGDPRFEALERLLDNGSTVDER